MKEAWHSCQGKWKQSALYLKLTNRKSTRTYGARVWMTRSQVADKYKSQSVADVICDAKLKDPELKKSHVKEHEDVDAVANPEVAEAMISST